MSLKLIHLNIEGSKHLERFLPFLESERPDVVCFQELKDSDLETIGTRLGMSYMFEPMLRLTRDGSHIYSGLGIFSRFPLHNIQVRQYAGCAELVEDFDSTSETRKQETERFVIVSVDIEKNAERYTIATTHFLWTYNGEANDAQRDAVQSLIREVSTLGECVLTGDFNAPRGKEIFTLLS